MQYFLQVKPKFTTWLIAALLALTAASSLPASRIAAPCASTEYAYLDNAHAAKHLTKRKLLPVCDGRSFVSSQFRPSLPGNDAAGLRSGLDRSLFQRPPPSFSL
ncbi:MAG: hypothetical protein JO138_22080 [Acidobacteriaceae bacterium]|nr:hypothetical protein [Acidobacteriaceae bacterium]